MTSEVLPSIRKTGDYELQALKNEMMLKEKEHAEEISKAMEQLSIKNTQIAAKDERHKTQITARASCQGSSLDTKRTAAKKGSNNRCAT